MILRIYDILRKLQYHPPTTLNTPRNDYLSHNRNHDKRYIQYVGQPTFYSSSWDRRNTFVDHQREFQPKNQTKLEELEESGGVNPGSSKLNSLITENTKKAMMRENREP